MIHVLSAVTAATQMISQRAHDAYLSRSSTGDGPNHIAPENHLIPGYGRHRGAGRRLRRPADEHVQRLIDFAAAWDRSARCGALLRRHQPLDGGRLCRGLRAQPARDELQIARAIRGRLQYRPANARIVAIADRLLRRDGRMVRAIESIGPGDAAAEGVPFRLDLAWESAAMLAPRIMRGQSERKTYGVVPPDVLRPLTPGAFWRASSRARCQPADQRSAPLPPDRGRQRPGGVRGPAGIRHYNPIGTVHAGFTATAARFRARLRHLLDARQSDAWTTIELKLNLVRPLTKDTGPVRAEGRVIHRGRSVATSEGDVKDTPQALRPRPHHLHDLSRQGVTPRQSLSARMRRC